MASMEMTRVLPPMMCRRLGVEMPIAQGLINRMEREGFLRTNNKTKRSGKVVDKTKLAETIEKYFGNPPSQQQSEPVCAQ